MHRRFLVAGILVAGALLVFWNVAPMPSSAAAAVGYSAPLPAQPATAPCTGANLSLRYIDTDAAMGGVREAGYAFKNIGSLACTLKGFPHVQLLNRRGQVVHQKLVKNTDDKPAVVTLEPQKEAFFGINFNSGGAGHEGPPCPSVPRLRIEAPGTTRWFNRSDEVDLCSDVEIAAISATAPF